MEKISAKDIWPNKIYEAARTEFRDRVIALKAVRRVALAEDVTLVFENRETLRLQIQEMLRAERIETPAGIQEEIDVYNALMPDRDRLSATLFIEVTEEARIKQVLHDLVGLEETVYLAFPGGEVRASFEEGRSDGARISAVQYVRFVLDPQRRAKFLQAKEGRLELRHPKVHSTVKLGSATLASLQGDLA
jgi:Protein of unknown function (DUF3501)